jgi:iron complex transport system ATP-binding protein
MLGSCLSLSKVKVQRGGRTILDIDDLQVPSGKFLGIIGTNGAGKTTLLKVCCGLIKPDQGTVKFDDTDLSAVSSWSKSNLRKRIGYIPQATEYNAELPFTLREVVAMGRAGIKPLLSRLNKEDYEHIDYWIDKLGLADLREQTFRSLSGGEQQKVLIARAMSQDPAVLMLDEPGTNLDFNWKYQITSIIDQLYQSPLLTSACTCGSAGTGGKRQGGHITILMVSHETDLLPPSCGRIVLLHEGQVLADDDAEKVFASEALQTAYQCRFETVEIGGRKYIYTMPRDS